METSHSEVEETVETDLQELSKLLKSWAITEPELSLILGNQRRIARKSLTTHSAKEREKMVQEIKREIAANKERGYNIEAAMEGILEKVAASRNTT